MRSAASIVATLHRRDCSFRLNSPPMRIPPQAVIGGSSLVHLHQEISNGAAARLTLTMIHWIIVRALRPSWTSVVDIA